MRKVLEILRLHFDHRLSQRQIARSTTASQSTIHQYITRFQASGLPWPLPESLSEDELQAALFPTPVAKPLSTHRPLPDFPQVSQELRRKHVTLQLLWEEYRAAHPDGYCYSRFCLLFEQWQKKQHPTMRQIHRAGEKLFVDWAGSTIPLLDRETGQRRDASLFLAVLGASSYTYAEATANQQMENWIGAHIRAFEFLRGLPELVVPDNTKTGVTRPCYYDPDLNPTYQEMAKHYGIAVLPTRVRKPRDKAKVEVGVQIAERWIIAALRHRQFFSLPELNTIIAALVDKINHKPFRNRSGSRAQAFVELDKPVLRPLPETRFDLSHWSKARVNIDYHIAIEQSLYSVPYPLVQQEVEVCATANVIEIFHRGQRVASHLRACQPGAVVTDSQHRPKAHRFVEDWPPSRIIAWAGKAGPNTARVVERILASLPHPEMGYRSCLGIIRLGGKYSLQRLEAACERALVSGAVRYRSIESMLRHALDQQPMADNEDRRGPNHDNVRGAEYFR